jgi:hypothetical protein
MRKSGVWRIAKVFWVGVAYQFPSLFGGKMVEVGEYARQGFPRR